VNATSTLVKNVDKQRNSVTLFPSRIPRFFAVSLLGQGWPALLLRKRPQGKPTGGLLLNPDSSKIGCMPSHLKLVIEKHPDGFVAYPLGLGRGAILGQGDTYEAALADVRSAIAFHVETFGPESLAPAEDGPILEAFVTEVAVPG